MTIQDVRKALAALGLRERLVLKLATVAGLRPGEIFGLRRGLVVDHGIDIQQRVYRGLVDTPKTQRSTRSVALSKMLREDIEAWLAQVPGGPKGWLFPSEKLKTLMSKDNFMYRFLRPALRKIGLEWVSYQVMRRTHSALMHQLKIDPKVVAARCERQLECVHADVNRGVTGGCGNPWICARKLNALEVR
jgi:integrase